MKTCDAKEKIQKTVQLPVVGSPKIDKLPAQYDSLDCQKLAYVLGSILFRAS